MRHAITEPKLGIHTLRIVVGLASLPFFDFGLAFVTFPLIWYSEPTLSNGPPPWDWTDPALSWASGVFIASVALTACGAAILIMVLLWRGHVRLRHAIIAGVVLSNAASIMFSLAAVVAKVAYGSPVPPSVGPPRAVLPAVFRAFIINTLMGGTSGAFFWLVAVWKGPFDGHSQPPKGLDSR